MKLTKRQLTALNLLRKDELVYERGECYIGHERFGARTFFSLLRMMAISHVPSSAKPGSGGLEIYRLNETGRQLLASPCESKVTA